MAGTDPSGSGAQRGFEPLTHALRIRRSLPCLIPINVLRTPTAICLNEKRRKSACAGTKVATVISVSPEHSAYGGAHYDESAAAAEICRRRLDIRLHASHQGGGAHNFDAEFVQSAAVLSHAVAADARY
jgi:hypothetical protein